MIAGWYLRKYVIDPQRKSVCSASTQTFSEAEYTSNAPKVIAYAAATGTAVVSAADGRPLVIISIPTVDLPTLD